MQEILKRIIDKATSGRFIFAVTSAIIFYKLSVLKILPVDKVVEIILIVVMAYYGINRNQKGGAQ